VAPKQRLPWNFATLRFLKPDNFLGTALCSYVLFADPGYTHPNLELRVLVANDRLGRTAQSEALIKTFTECRIDHGPRILYQAK